jgi:bacteriorhodopsin
MPAWKVLLIVALACASFALATATVIVPMSEEGTQRWAWLAGLLVATIVVGAGLVLLLRQASEALMLKPRGGRY